MSSVPGTHHPPLPLGMASLVLGSIGLLFFFLPVLGIPVSAFGLLLGIVGFFVVLFGGEARLRTNLIGIAVSSLALAINLAVGYAPAGYLPGREVPRSWQSPSDRPYVSPPAH
jgi:hypothetical protein